MINDLWVTGELVHCRVLQHSDKPGHDSARILRHTQSQKTPIGNEVNIVFRFKNTNTATADRFLISYVTLLTVGVGSSLFHMTLKYGRIYQFLKKDLFQHNNPPQQGIGARYWMSSQWSTAVVHSSTVYTWLVVNRNRR